MEKETLGWGLVGLEEAALLAQEEEQRAGKGDNQQVEEGGVDPALPPEEGGVDPALPEEGDVEWIAAQLQQTRIAGELLQATGCSMLTRIACLQMVNH